jgi:Subtilase family
MIQKENSIKSGKPEIPNSSINDIPQKYTVSIKFKEGINARLSSDNKLKSLSGNDVSPIEKIVNKYDVKLKPAFDEPEEKLLSDMESLKSITAEVPNLSRYYTIHTEDKNRANDLVKELSSQETIESVELVPIGEDANTQLVTPSFIDKQGYLGPSPDGIDALYAWQFTGSKGDGIKIIDIEQAWNFEHEDLQQNQGGLIGGVISTNIRSRNHGTAVMGVIGGNENKFGIIGIVPHCHQSAYSVWDNNGTYSFHTAMKNSADVLSQGDIILIEQHAAGPDASGQGQDGYIAMEFWDINFDSIKYATSKGIIVVEAAGNGFRDLDNPIFQNKFNRDMRDSGAILVGAGAPPSGNHGPDRSRLNFSNWGSIIDVQGWGREVVTTGYGDLQNGEENKSYTSEFSGTSSASPIIVGAIVCLQGIKKSKGEPYLTFNIIRNLFRTTGSPQQDAPNRPKTQRIGNRPNLKEILNQL